MLWPKSLSFPVTLSTIFVCQGQLCPGFHHHSTRHRERYVFSLGGGENISFSQRNRKRGVDGVMTWMKIFRFTSVKVCFVPQLLEPVV